MCRNVCQSNMQQAEEVKCKMFQLKTISTFCRLNLEKIINYDMLRGTVKSLMLHFLFSSTEEVSQWFQCFLVWKSVFQLSIGENQVTCAYIYQVIPAFWKVSHDFMWTWPLTRKQGFLRLLQINNFNRKIFQFFTSVWTSGITILDYQSMTVTITWNTFVLRCSKKPKNEYKDG